MSDTIIDLNRAQYRRLERLIRSSNHGRTVRRALGLKHLSECNTYREAADRVESCRKSLYRWEDRWRDDGIYGLRPRPQGAPKTTVTRRLKDRLRELLAGQPSDHGYAAARWTSSLLAEVLARVHGLQAHPSTLRRLLRQMGYRWRRARPAPSWRQDPNKEEKLAAIEEAVAIQASYTDVFFVDEARVELLPKIGFGWRPIGEQTTLVTPGRNDSRYLAAGIHKDTGLLTWSEGASHDTDLILDLLERLHLRYRRSKEIVVIMDNAPSHTSKRTRCWLENHDRFEVRWQPTYTPEPNRVETLWKQLHRTVTRNHQHQTMESLMEAVRSWMEAVEHFPNPAARSARIDPAKICKV